MDDATRQAVVAEALTWLGTPYHHHARVKGVGVDCAQLLCAVYEACGLVPHIDPGNYAHDWHLHRGEEVFIGWLEKVGAREVSVPAPGDVAVFRYGRAYSHGAVVVNDKDPMAVVHAYLGRGVVRSRLDEEPLQGRAVRFWCVIRLALCFLELNLCDGFLRPYCC
jgi:NlpC/P60 family putative phage cell wall peptidase